MGNKLIDDTLYSYYELGVWTMQLILQKSMKTSGNKCYEKISFENSIIHFLSKINDKMLSLLIDFPLSYENISLEIMDEVSDVFSEPQRDFKQSAYFLGKYAIFLHSMSLLTYNSEDFKELNSTKNKIFICLKVLNINDDDIFNCFKFEQSDYSSYDLFEESINQKIDYFHMLIKLYLSKITLFSKPLDDCVMTKHKYDVALSFAGEDRRYVDLIANALKNKGIRVFYDRFETANLWGKDLYQYLSHIYKDNARYCIIFVSLSYKNKAWTKHELKNAQNRAFLENKEYILPIFLEDVELDGLNDTIGYIKASEFTESEIVDLIIEKIL